MGMNYAAIEGYLANEPEFRVSAKKNEKEEGYAVISFCVAVQSNYRDKNGDKKTDFIDCIAFASEKREKVFQSLHKGSHINVWGSLTVSTFKDKNGVNHKTTKIKVDGVSFLDKKDTKKDDDPAEDDKFTNIDEALNGEEDLPF